MNRRRAPCFQCMDPTSHRMTEKRRIRPDEGLTDPNSIGFLEHLSRRFKNWTRSFLVIFTDKGPPLGRSYYWVAASKVGN